MSDDIDGGPFVLDGERRALRALVRDHAAREWDEAALRAAIGPGARLDRDRWRRLGSELGVLGPDVPATWGGGGGGLPDTVLAAEELGAALAPVPYAGTVLAAWTLLASGDEEALAEHLPALCAGTSVYAVACTDARGAWMPPRPSVRAEGGAVTGTAAHVVGAPDADHLIVLAATGDGPSLFVADVGAPGLAVTPITSLDLTRPQATVVFDGTPARPVGTPGRAVCALSAAADRAVVAVAAEALGASARLLADTVRYAGTRMQFGRAIGSHQAVKHRCADVLTAVEQTRSVVYHAAWTADFGGDDPALTASLARTAAAATLTAAADAAVQIHGGMGFTWEHTAHLYFKRAHFDAVLWGGLASHRERIAALVLDVLEPAPA
ncbi:acyl-CoA dehydrogenase family protein [Actinomadura algeriensis]|uniref:Alkylation response protein AidB-like acyl-CoA dehydrogenase n=1 Tax=Actinomadura algeriensis TaxID=1679523 RepID=A0ABR9JZK0_9ACTN|nr:acyl-CoA dehydrogenase [Actinomadura algeriensis]MBE1535888.1 alkylation response protein AidB-like acyl-CoA dehydrogenase [Actinomadura algeriensis]